MNMHSSIKWIIASTLILSMLTACSNNKAEQSEQQAETATTVSSSASNEHTNLSQNDTKQPSNSKEEDMPASNEKTFTLQDYAGTWIDTEFNQYEGDNHLNSVEINRISDTVGEISIFLYNPYRITDSSADFKLEGNVATFQFEDSAGQGTGTLTLEPNQLKIKLDLLTGDEELTEVYQSERTFVRKPYEGLTYYDPLELMNSYVIDKQELADLTFQLDEGAEWNEELNASPEQEIVVGVDQKGQIVRRFYVNLLNKHIIEYEVD